MAAKEVFNAFYHQLIKKVPINFDSVPFFILNILSRSNFLPHKATIGKSKTYNCGSGQPS